MKQHDDLISIILPCYKAENYIANIIDDILGQDYRSWELIIISNGKDQEKQLEIINNKCCDLDNVKVLISDMGSVSNARNLGIDQAKGEWITFVDADDRVSTKYLSTLYSKADDDIDIVFGGIVRYSVIDNKEYEYKLPIINEINTDFVTLDEILTRSPWSKLIRKSVIEECHLYFDSNYTYAEDALFMFSLYEYTQRFASVELSGYKYMIYSSGSACTKYHDQLNYENIHNILLELERRLRERVLTKEETLVWYNNKRFINSYFCFMNLFREDAHLELKEKINITKKLIFNDYFRSLLCNHSRRDRNFQIDSFFFLSKYTNAGIMTLAFEILSQMKYKFGSLYKFFKRRS